MERFLLGHCRSGKNSSSYPALDDLRTDEEIFDAMAMLSAAATREYRRNKESDIANQLAQEASNLEQVLIGRDQLASQMQRIGAKTSIDIARHAIRLLRPEFKD